MKSVVTVRALATAIVAFGLFIGGVVAIISRHSPTEESLPSGHGTIAPAPPKASDARTEPESAIDKPPNPSEATQVAPSPPPSPPLPQTLDALGIQRQLYGDFNRVLKTEGLQAAYAFLRELFAKEPQGFKARVRRSYGFRFLAFIYNQDPTLREEILALLGVLPGSLSKVPSASLDLSASPR